MKLACLNRHHQVIHIKEKTSYKEKQIREKLLKKAATGVVYSNDEKRAKISILEEEYKKIFRTEN